MRALLFTAGSPFARAARIVLDEIGLDWERREEITTPSIEERASATPTLQVPTLWDGDRVLWESGVIVDYLMATYRERTATDPSLAMALFRPEMEWDDKQLLATIQTLGTAITTISQMTWTGQPFDENTYLTRCAERLPHLLNWLETQLPDDADGFIPDCLSGQDIFLTCHLRFMQNRPLGLHHDFATTPKIAALLDRLDQREAFRANPIYWWEPGVTGYSTDGTPVYDR